MRTSKLILILLILFFVLIGATSFTYYYLHKPDIIAVDMDLIVEDSKIIGVNSDTDALHFGTVPRGSMSIRKINISSNKDYPLLINVIIDGNFKDWVSVMNNTFILQPKELGQIEFIVKVPKNAPFNSYNGTAYIFLRRY